MKKNMMMRIASVLMIAVLMSTSAISGTYAKYVTKGSSQDNARVAKWGVGVTGAADMFKTDYAKDDASFTLEENTVVSSNDNKLVAPGTKGALTDVKLEGTPEVAVRVTYEATLTLDGWVVNGDYYCPIIITVEETPLNGMDYKNVTEFQDAVEDAIENCKRDYEALTDLSGVGDNAPTVTWEWPFSTSADNDVKDTKLGDVAVTGDAATIDLTVKTTVTQIN